MKNSTFPAFLRLEFDGGSGFPEFERQMDQSFERAGRKAKATSEQIANEFSRALGNAKMFDLGANDLRASAQAAQVQAAALRTVASNAVAAEGATSSYARAAETAATQAERHASRLNLQSANLDRLEREMNEAAAASQRLAGANQLVERTHVGAAGAVNGNRFAMVQMGQQFQDFAVQVQGGQNPLIAFTQQMSQAAFIATTMGGTMGRLGGFIAGPWGTALILGTAVLGPMIVQMIGLGKESDATKKAMDAQTGATDTLTEALKTLDQAMGRTLGSAGQLRAEAIGLANARIFEAEATRVRAQAELDLARSMLEVQKVRASAPGERGDIASLGLDTRNSDIAAKERRLVELDGQIAIARTKVQVAVRADEKTRSDEATKASDKALKAAERAARARAAEARREESAAKRAAAELERAEDSATRIAERFGPRTGLLGDMASATGDLNKLLKEFEGRTDDGAKKLREAVAAAQAAVNAGPKKVAGEALDALDRELQVLQLLLNGRELEAAVLQDKLDLMDEIGVKTEDELTKALQQAGYQGDITQALTDRLASERAISRELEIQRQRQQVYLRAVDDVQAAIEKAIFNAPDRGLGSIKDFTNDFARTMKGVFAQTLTEKLFGDSLRKLQDQITGQDPARQAAIRTAASFDTTTASAKTLGDQFDALARKVAAAANDNAASNVSVDADGIEHITVTAQKAIGQSIDEAKRSGKVDIGDPIGNADGLLGGFMKGQTEFGKALSGDIEKVFGKVFGMNGEATAGLGQALGTAFAGSQFGGAIGTAFTDIFGIKGSKMGAQIGGAIGSAFGPLGSAIGGMLGSVVGGALKKTKTGSATIGVGANGELIVTGLSGSSGKFKKAANENAGGAITSIERIAEALGGTVNASRGSVSIGFRDGKARVDTTGRGITKTKKGAIDFGEDIEAAVKFATMDLIKDGVIEGLRASTQRLLQNSKDLEAGLDKALKFENVFRDLKRIKDPVGAAMDDLDREFTSLKKIFAEAGASTEEYAKLEELYGFKRKDAVEQANEAILGSLKAFLAELTTGDNGRSLRDRQSAAKAIYDPLAARVAAGDTTAFDDFSDAARTLLDIQRQISGSQTDYFALLDQITALTKTAVAGQENVSSISAGRPGLFAPSGTSPSSASTAAPVVGAVDRLGERLGGILGAQLTALNRNVGTTNDLLRGASGGGGGGGGFRGKRLNF